MEQVRNVTILSLAPDRTDKILGICRTLDIILSELTQATIEALLIMCVMAQSLYVRSFTTIFMAETTFRPHYFRPSQPRMFHWTNLLNEVFNFPATM